MKGAVNKPVSRLGTPGGERPRPLAMRTSSLSYGSESQLSKAKSRSSDDLPLKTGISNPSRMKKTVTMGAISELTENRVKMSGASLSSLRRSAIPAPRGEASTPGSGPAPPPPQPSPLGKDRSPRERPRSVPGRKPGPGAGGDGVGGGGRNVRASATAPGSAGKPLPPPPAGEREALDAHIKQLVSEAKAKDLELSKLRRELQRERAAASASPASLTPTEAVAGPGERQNGVPGSGSACGLAAPTSPGLDFDDAAAALRLRLTRLEEERSSAAEELAATAQELSDQQLLVQELSADNERLSSERRALDHRLQRERDNLGRLVRENRELAALLEAARASARTQSQAQALTQAQAQAQATASPQAGGGGEGGDQLQSDPRELEVQRLRSLLAAVESNQPDSHARCECQARELSSATRRLQEEAQERESQIREMKETIFELQDQVEQHRAVKLHSNQAILELENTVLKLEEQNRDLEKQLKQLNKKLKEDSQEWRCFQADLQTAVVVANDIKCEAQQEVRALRRRLQEEEARSERLDRELETVHSHRLTVAELPSDPLTFSADVPWPRDPSLPLAVSAQPTPKVKMLIKCFDVSHSAGSGSPSQIPRSSPSSIPLRAPPAAAVSPMQRHSTSTPPSLLKTALKGTDKQLSGLKLPLTGTFQERLEGYKPDRYQSSPSRETSAFTSRSPIMSPTSPDQPHSKLSVERKDPLAALAREYGGSKRNALLRWCQRKTEDYPNIEITNFSSSWSDGLAFCALLHTYLPAHIPFHQLSGHDRKRNLTLAFQAAESVGIKSVLDLNEMIRSDRPDWQSLMQYVGQIYRYFET